MRKKLLLLIIPTLITLMFPQNARAATSVYTVASNASLTLGQNVTVSVIIDSGSDTFDTAQARLTYNNSILDFVSHSSVSLNEVEATRSSNSIFYAGYTLPPPLSGVKTMYTVTFKSIALGTANISLSDVLVLRTGNTLASAGSSTAITVNNPPASNDTGSGNNTPTSNNNTPTQTNQPKPIVALDTTPPTISGDVLLNATQSTIKVGFSTSEASKVKLTYFREGEDPKTIEINDLKTSHELLVGENDPLTPGFIYKIQIALTDSAGNASDLFVYDKKTVGVDFRVRLTDKNKNPIPNQPVQLFSDPINAITDKDGVAVFQDVAIGEHTLSIEIEGVTIRKPVVVGQPLSLNSAGADIIEINLPISVVLAQSKRATNYRSLLIVAITATALQVTALAVLYVLKRLNQSKHKKLIKTEPEL